MIKYTRQGNGLKDFVDQVSFIDTNQYSKDYFRVMDFPTRLFLGKNAFRISGNNETLVRGSRIYIDVVDVNGNIIYHEILNVKNKDLSRTVVVYVYGDIPPGEVTVYIAGRIGTDPRTGRKLPYSESPVDRNFKDVPNIMWVGKAAAVVSKQNTSEVFFTREPSISYAERLVSFAVVSGSTDRTILTTGSNNTTVSLNSRTVPAQYGGGSVFETEMQDSPNKFRGIPDVVNNTGESKEALAIPEYTPLTTIKTNIPFFIRDMEGGTITVSNITVGSVIPKDAPAGAFTNIPAYSASIVRVLNETSIEVNKPFTSKISYTSISGENRQTVLNQFIDQSDFSVAYYDTSATISKTMASESYVSLEFRDMEPAAGTVDKIRVSYKPAAGFGSFIDVGEFKIEEQNILIDSASFELTRDRGLVERRIGFVPNATNMNLYWNAIGVGISGADLIKRDTNVMDGFQINHSGSLSDSAYVYVKQQRDFITTVENTEYKLKFKSYSSEDLSGKGDPFIDVYISGSGIVADQINRGNITTGIIHDLSLGTFIGTVSSKMGKMQTNEMFFISKDRKPISPVFVVRSGIWDIGQIEIIPRKEVGFSPNHVKLNIPLNRFEQSSELIIDVDYLNSDGVAANLDSRLYGVFFTGGQSEMSQSLVVVNREFLSTSSSMSERITGTVSGSDIRFYDAISGSTAGTLSRLEITAKTRMGASGSGGQIGLVANTHSLAGGQYIVRGADHRYLRPSTNEHVYSRYLGVWSSSFSRDVTVNFPILRRSDNNAVYDGTSEHAFMVYQIDSAIIGLSGSSGTYAGSYIWGHTMRGRITIANGSISYDNFSATSSMVNYDGFERFGLPAVDKVFNGYKLEKALSAGTHSISLVNGTLNVPFRFSRDISLGGSLYDTYIVSNIKVIKMEYLFS